MARPNSAAVRFEETQAPFLERRIQHEETKSSPSTSSNSTTPAPELTEDERFAAELRETVPSMSIYMTLGRLLRNLPPQACKIFRDQLIRDCGSPSDPVEVMLLEQLATSHLCLGVLNNKAALSESVEGASAYWGASARLMAEFRRTALALQSYRSGPVADRKSRRPEDDASTPEQKHRDSKLVKEANDRDANDQPIRLNAI